MSPSVSKTPPVASQAQPTSRWLALVKMVDRLRRFAWDILGVAVLAFAMMTLLTLLFPAWTSGFLLNLWRRVLRLWLGWGSLFVVLGGMVAGLLILRRQPTQSSISAEQAQPEDKANSPAVDLLGAQPSGIPWNRIFSLEIAALAGVVLFAILGNSSLERANAELDGGRVGWGLAELLRLILNPVGLSGKFWLLLIAGSFTLFCLLHGLGLLDPLGQRFQRWLNSSDKPAALPVEPAVSLSGAEEPQPTGGIFKRSARREPLPAEFRKRLRLQPGEEKSTPPPPRDERLPPLDILSNEQGQRPDERNINLTAGLIEKTLAEFGIPAKVIGFRVGPTVTQFAIEPGFMDKLASDEDSVKQKVRVSQISALRRDLALALSAERLRIEAPVPGRPYVGIEVPNIKSSIVRLRPILENEAFYKIGSPLTIALGRDVSGQPVVADLARMPHLLIAGTTGSGKSICIAALTAGLVMNNTPQELRLVMIDPKMVELVRFNGLPHLFGKVETDLERILGVLRWVVAEMERRYKLLEQMRARHIESYNRKVQRRKGAEVLPHIVVMLDELADLMMSAPEQTEHTLVRLAQMARATGIHLVVATQRPSADVVTGLIKANFPARIAFAVASSVDSRVILDTTGAESLLGHGDMLFLPPEAPAPMRCQGVMISDAEVEKVITFWQQAHPTPTEEQPPWEVLLAEETVAADRDDLVNKAIAIVRDTQRASTSMLQRRLRVGYPRAARLIDELEDLGIVGPSQGGGREREVLIGPDDEIPGENRTDEDNDEDV